MLTRVCFITPPSAFLLDERVFVSLGILKVAAALEARGYDVEHLDLSGVSNYEDAARLHAQSSAATHYALTATTPQLPAAAKIVRVLREEQPAARLLLGGPHATVTSAAVKKNRSRRAVESLEQILAMFDVVIAGDGEDAIVPALAKSAAKFIDADERQGPLFLTNKRLNETPWPARHLVDMASYHYTIDGVRSASLIAQLGCPFSCAFCSGRSSPMLRKIRMRTTENIVAEMEHLHRAYGFRSTMLYDDELNVNPKVVELMRAIAALGDRLGFEWKLRGFVKAELFTAEQAEAMYAAGFRWLLCGFESGSPRILDNIQKKATIEDNDRCVAIARKAGLKVKALMSIGHAGESPETIAETREWLLRTRPDDFDCTIITPYPGSPYYDDAVENDGAWTFTAKSGDALHMRAFDYAAEADYYKGRPGDYVSHVHTDGISARGLVEERDELEAKVRAELGIPYNHGAPGIQFEASMGQTKLPDTILRRTPEREGEVA